MSIAETLAAIQSSQPDIEKTEQPTPPEPQTATQQVEERGPSRSTPELLKDISNIRIEALARLAALPDEQTILIRAERERVWQLRKSILGTLSEMTSPMEGRVAKLDARLADRKHRRSLLTAARIDLEKALAAVEDAGNHDFKLDQALRVSLRMIQHGEDAEGMFATPLMSWLHKNGYRPELGAANFFTGFRGLMSLEADIEELNKERSEFVAQVEAALAQAKLLLSDLKATV